MGRDEDPRASQGIVAAVGDVVQHRVRHLEGGTWSSGKVSTSKAQSEAGHSPKLLHIRIYKEAGYHVVAFGFVKGLQTLQIVIKPVRITT